VTGAGWTAGSFASDGERIYYERAGAGEPVVFCHGLGGNHAVWFQQVPVFAERFDVITWDQRGFGMSTNNAGESGPAAAVRDIGALLDHLSLQRVHLIGQSMGGWAVMGFAVAAPDRVASLTICDSTAGVWTDTIRDAFANREAPKAPEARIGAHTAVGRALRERDVVKAFLYQQIGSFRGPIGDAEMVSRLFETRYSIGDVARLAMPVLAVVGADDDLIPPAAVHAIAEMIPGAIFVEIANSGHSPYFEQPDAWNDAVMRFLCGE
jgi:pimeloyl-ACP methyl ester carboxylesterase